MPFHEAVNLAAVTRARSALPVQNINDWHRRSKSWLMRFKGVASRYLAHYSGRRRLLDARDMQTPAQWLRAVVQQPRMIWR
jgi:hypothetical protein